MKRGVVLAVLVMGCGNDSPQDNGHDAYVPPADAIDGSTAMCSALAGTSNVTVNGATTTVFTRLDAGGTLNSGPLAPVAGVPISLSLLFTNADPLLQYEASCCQGHATGCCAATGVVVTTASPLPAGGELGVHPVMLESFDGTLTITGTIMITSFTSPWDHPPGRIAGSLSTLSNQVTGTFDNAFCQAILNITI